MNAAKPGTPPTATQRQNEAFQEVVINDLIPMIDAAYRTIPDKEHRAIARLSMGAVQAIQIGLSHTDRFSYIGSFSGIGICNFDPKTSYGGVFSDPAAFNRNVRVLWFGAGTAEASWGTSGKVLVEAMNKAGIEAVWYAAIRRLLVCECLSA